MNFKLEELGDLRANAERDAKFFAESNWQALRGFGEETKNAVRADLRASGIKGAARLANAWRGKVFPARASAHASKPAYVLGSQAAKIVETFEQGPTINAKGGALLVPIGPARRIRLKPGQPKTALLEEAKRIYGVTRLVTQWLKRTRQFALGVYSTLEGGKRKFIPLFVLVKRVQAPKLLKGAAIIERKSREAPARVADETWSRFERRRAQAQNPGGYRVTVRS